MTVKTQLLCTFCDVENIDDVVNNIIQTYNVVFDTIYILENVEVAGSLCCTYNIDMNAPTGAIIPSSTISLHRKKATNTLYTINALNLLIAELNGGHVNKDYKIQWDDYRNTILVTAYNKLKRINTKLNRIIDINDLP